MEHPEMKDVSTPNRNLALNAVINWIGFAAQVLVTFLLAPILIRALGSSRYGIWSLVESVLTYLMLFDLGVAASVVRYVARFEATGNQAGLNRVFSTSVCIFLVAGLCVLVCAFVAGFFLPLPADMESEGRSLLLLLGFNLAVGLPLSVFPSILDGLGRYPAKTAARTAGLLLRIPLFLFVVHTDGGLVGLAWMITGINLAENLVHAVIARHYLPGLRFSFSLADRATFKTIKGYSLDAFLAMIAGRVSFQTDAIVIGAFLAPEYIAFFAIAGKLVDYAKTSLRTATTVLTPAVSTLEARGDLPAIRKMLIKTTRYVLWIILPIEIGLLILGKPFLTLWLADPFFVAMSYPTLVILALPLFLAISQSVSGRILYGMGRLRWFSRLLMAEAAVNLILSVLLVQPLGIEGVAWGTTIPNFVANAVLAAYVCRMLNVGIGSYVRHAFVAPCCLALLLAAGWLTAACCFDLTSWLPFLVTAAVGSAGYLFLVAVVEVDAAPIIRRCGLNFRGLVRTRDVKAEA
jgi:O-antigen/teichoic acid export membrane protein